MMTDKQRAKMWKKRCGILQSQLETHKYRRLASIRLSQYFRDENKELQSQLEERDAGITAIKGEIAVTHSFVRGDWSSGKKAGLERALEFLISKTK